MIKRMENNSHPFFLSASLICGDFLNLKKEIKSLEKGKVDMIHFDVMDGNFVPRLGLFPEIFTAIKSISDLPVDIHLMVNNPEDLIPIFSKSPKDTLTVHAETCPHLHRVIQKIKEAKMMAGIALNPATPINAVDYLLEDLSLIVIMAINPGILGHRFIPQMINKIKSLKHKIKNNKKILIEIDGGVTNETAPLLLQAGADILVCGSSTIFNQDKPIDRKLIEFRRYLSKNTTFYK
jgi:ribulose-phosphate 3-epimerase